MKLNWPWQHQRSGDRLVIGGTADALVFAHSDSAGRLKRCGSAARAAESPQDLGRRLRGLGLPHQRVCAVLALHEAQLLQVEAPAVRAEEMKAAARWKVKDQVSGHVDELTIDVMFVGDERPRAARQLFVAAARNDTVRGVVRQSQACGLEVSVIELAETSQRNLHSALAAAEGLGQRATAALVRHGTQCLLTICAGGELFYTRRLDWQDLRADGAPPAAQAPIAAALDELELQSADYIDYGAEPAAGAAPSGEAPRLVIELQRSFDVWERSWPELPLAALWVQAGEGSAGLVATLQAALGQRVGLLDAERVFPGFALAADTPALRAAVLPLLGALLRQEPLSL